MASKRKRATEVAISDDEPSLPGPPSRSLLADIRDRTLENIRRRTRDIQAKTTSIHVDTTSVLNETAATIAELESWRAEIECTLAFLRAVK